MSSGKNSTQIIGQIVTEETNQADSTQNEGDDGEGVAENLLKAQVKISKNDFIFCKVVGRGSFGKVYLVKKKDKPEIPLALKVLSKDVDANRNLQIKTQGIFFSFYSVYKFCVAERDILEKIDSSFIFKLHYAFQTEAKLYFAMDFLNGGELSFHLRKEFKFPERRACFYAAQLVEAIRCLHQNGVIYRDLKPKNVLLDYNGNLKITDFGLSKQGVDTGDSEQRTFSFCGTPEYLAPEII